MNGLPNTGNALADAQTLGRGLMRGNRDELKLGYTWENALMAAVEMYEMSEEDRLTLALYLRGFSRGIGATPENADEQAGVIAAFSEGCEDGYREAVSGKLYPAEISS